MASRIAVRSGCCIHGLLPSSTPRLVAALPLRHHTTTTTPLASPRDLPPSAISKSPVPRPRPHISTAPSHSPRYKPSRAPQAPAPDTLPSGPVAPHVREMLPVLAAQAPHYITIHLHGRPYLVTQGDTVRLPFVMHGVAPGDVLRLNRASVLGSRDFALRGGAIPGAAGTVSIEATGAAYAVDAPRPRDPEIGRTGRLKKVGAAAYIDERLFVCRATVLGTESEPLRYTIKKKQRNRHTRRIQSKLRFTVLKISELRIADVERIAEGAV